MIKILQSDKLGTTLDNAQFGYPAPMWFWILWEQTKTIASCEDTSFCCWETGADMLPNQASWRRLQDTENITDDKIEDTDNITDYNFEDISNSENGRPLNNESSHKPRMW